MVRADRRALQGCERQCLRRVSARPPPPAGNHGADRRQVAAFAGLPAGGVTKAIDIGERVRLAAILADTQVFSSRRSSASRWMISCPCRRKRIWRRSGQKPAAISAPSRHCLMISRCAIWARAGPASLSYGAYHEAETSLFPAGIAGLGGVTPFDGSGISEDVAFSWFSDTAETPFEAETRPCPERRRLLLGQGPAYRR